MMRRPVDSAARPVVTPTTVPAPVGGWNARDSLATMKPTDALILDNLFPRATDVELRRGSNPHATVPSGSIRGLLAYSPVSGIDQLFATTETGIYDVTAGGDVLVAASPSTGSEWQSTMITTAGGNFLWCCNAKDDSRYFDGTTWHILTPVSTPALTGVDSKIIQDVVAFKSRLLLTVKNSLSFYHLPVNSIAGAATEYPCGELFNMGGAIASIASWTVDAGDGADDYLCIITTEGEVAVFKGTDLASATDWSLQGIYRIGRPIGKRSTFKFGGDLCVITDYGVLQMSGALMSADLNRTSSLSDKISQAFSNYALTFGTTFGWQAVVHTSQMAMLVNVPLGLGRSYQFVMNTLTKAWCRFTDWHAEVLCTCGNRLFFASGGIVRVGWEEFADSGTSIKAAAKTAFNNFRSGTIKAASLIRPIFTATANLFYAIGIDTDFEDNNIQTSATTIAQSLAKWDLSAWDEAVWTTGSLTVARWRSVNHKPGRSLALRLRFSAKNVTVTWSATDFILRPGGFM